MAQVNSSPGQNQTFGNVAVVSAVSEATGVPDVKTISTAKIVVYGQNEPGTNGDRAINKIRS